MNVEYIEPWIVPVGPPESYKQVAPNIHILEARLTPDQWAYVQATVPEAAVLYRPVYRGPNVVISDAVTLPSFFDRSEEYHSDWPIHSWWLDIGRVPPGERSRWTTVLAERNLKEAEDLMEFIELYEWQPQKQRFIIRPAHRAWLEENEV